MRHRISSFRKQMTWLSIFIRVIPMWDLITIVISKIYCYIIHFQFQTEKDTRSDSSDETLSSTDESINANTPSKKNNLTKQKSSKATTGNSVQSNEDHHLQNNHEKIQ